MKNTSLALAAAVASAITWGCTRAEAPAPQSGA